MVDVIVSTKVRYYLLRTYWPGKKYPVVEEITTPPRTWVEPPPGERVFLITETEPNSTIPTTIKELK